MPTRRFTILVLVIAAFAGCSQEGGTISGSVTFNGQPVEAGSISFRPADGMGQILAARIENGNYSIAGATPGGRTVAIRGTKKVKLALSSEESARAAAAAEAAGNQAGVHIGDPADYIAEDAEGNNSTVELTGGDQTLDFALKGAAQ
jgi:hypothetical protein